MKDFKDYLEYDIVGPLSIIKPENISNASYFLQTLIKYNSNE